MIKRICTYCLAFLGYKSDGKAKPYERAWQESHGICKVCLARELGKEDPFEAWQEYGGEGG